MEESESAGPGYQEDSATKNPGDKWKACFKHPNIACRNVECFSWDHGTKHYCLEDPHERLTLTTEVKDMSDFHKGARAFFDSLLSRSANHWHANPEINKLCNAENKLIEDWAAEALLDVSPDSYHEWTAAHEMYRRGKIEGSRITLEELAHQKPAVGVDAEGRRLLTRTLGTVFWSLCLMMLVIGTIAAFQRGVPGRVEVSYIWYFASVVTGFIGFVLWLQSSKEAPEHHQGPPLEVKNGFTPPYPMPPASKPAWVGNDQTNNGEQ